MPVVANQCQTFPANAGHSHSIVNRAFLHVQFNNIFFAQLTIPSKIPCSAFAVHYELLSIRSAVSPTLKDRLQPAIWLIDNLIDE